MIESKTGSSFTNAHDVTRQTLPSLKQDHIVKATLLGLLAAIGLSIMALFVKLAAPHTTNSMTIFFRFLVGLIYVLFIGVYRTFKGKAIQFKATKFHYHVIRAITGVTSMMLFYYTFRYVSLANGTLLIMISPLFVPIIGLILFRQKTCWSVIVSALIGFIGVAMVLHPGAGIFNPVSLLGVIGAVGAAISLLMIRKISQQDPPFTSLLYYFPMAVIISGLLSIYDWQTPNWHTLMLLLGVGIFGTAYQDCLVRASQYAPSTLVSTLLYASIILSGILDWWFWGDTPSQLSIIGMIVVFSGACLTVVYSKKSRQQ